MYSGVCHCTHSNSICRTGLLCVQRKTPDDGQRNCPKYVEFYSKNKFEKLVRLVGFIVRIFHDARSPEGQKIFKTVISDLLEKHFSEFLQLCMNGSYS